MEAGDAARNDAGDARRRQLIGRGQDPFALFVELADDPGPNALVPVIELFLELVFHQRALFLDDQDLFQPLGEMAHAIALQRPGHAHLVDDEADFGGVRFVDAEIVERLADIEIGFAAGDDAKAPLRAIHHHAIELVGPGKGECRIELVLVQAHLLLQRLGGGEGGLRPADVEPFRRHGEIVGDADIDAMGIDIAGGRAVDGLRHHLEGDPAAGIARHGPAIEAHIEEFLHARRVQYRDAGIHEGVFALMRGGRGFAGVIVAGQKQHAAVLGRAGKVAVTKHIAAAVDARTLAVPHGKDAVVFRIAKEIELLAAPDGGGREILVDPGLELDVVFLEEFFRLPHGEIDAAQGRAAIAGDIAGGVEAGREIALALHHRQSHQGLGPGDEDPAAFQPVFVVECDGVERHGPSRGAGFFLAASLCMQLNVSASQPQLMGERRRANATKGAALSAGAIRTVAGPPRWQRKLL